MHLYEINRSVNWVTAPSRQAAIFSRSPSSNKRTAERFGVTTPEASTACIFSLAFMASTRLFPFLYGSSTLTKIWTGRQERHYCGTPETRPIPFSKRRVNRHTATVQLTTANVNALVSVIDGPRRNAGQGLADTDPSPVVGSEDCYGSRDYEAPFRQAFHFQDPIFAFALPISDRIAMMVATTRPYPTSEL